MSHNQFILAIDQGTTSSRSLLIDQKGKVIAIAQQEFTQHFPQPGWVEHNADEIWQTQYKTILEAVDVAKISLSDIAAIGITNQRETTVVWDKMTGNPICYAIVWQDRRTSAFCQELIDDGHASVIKEKTGLVIDAYFSASKIRWILQNVSGGGRKSIEGRIGFWYH